MPGERPRALPHGHEFRPRHDRDPFARYWPGPKYRESATGSPRIDSALPRRKNTP